MNIDIREDGGSPTLTASRMSVYFTDTGMYSINIIAYGSMDGSKVCTEVCIEVWKYGSSVCMEVWMYGMTIIATTKSVSIISIFEFSI